MSKHRVLVVDDSHLMREWSRNVLEAEQVEVVTRNDGEECCRDVMGIDPNVIMLDLEMPVMDGMSAIRELRSRDTTRHIPILVFTSKTSLDTKIEALKAGANDFLSKDADEAELVARVKSLLRVTDLEKEIISEKNKLNCILNDLADPVIIVDPAGQLILANEAASTMLGVTPERFTRLRADDFIGGMKNGEVVLEALKTDKSVEIEVERETEEKVHVYRIVVTTVYQSQQIPLGKALLFHDMTRENEIQQMKADFMSMIAHDLRSPISVITGYTGLLLGRKAGELNDTQVEFLDGVQSRAKVMLKLVDEFLTVSEFESSFVKLDVREMGVGDVVRDSIKALSIIATTKKISLDWEGEDGLPLVKGDPEKLYKVFTNLIDNALKYTPEGGAVSVTCRRAHGGVEVEVKDTGIGISNEEMEFVFDRYKRASGATKRKIKGTGLGLTIVSEIVNAHHGKVWAESTEGEGSKFFVLLPGVEKTQDRKETADIKK